MITGAAELARRFTDARGKLYSELSQLTFDAAEKTCARAKALAPVGEGQRRQKRLRDSFSFEASGLSAVVTAANPHAAYVEFGTGRRGAATGTGEGYDMEWAGMASQPYMTPAADMARGEYAQALAQGVRNVLSAK